MPDNDRSDALSVRDDDDERRKLKALEQETELRLGRSEARDTGGPDHASREEREGLPAAGAAPAHLPPGPPEGSSGATREAGRAAGAREAGSPGPGAPGVGEPEGG